MNNSDLPSPDGTNESGVSVRTPGSLHTPEFDTVVFSLGYLDIREGARRLAAMADERAVQALHHLTPDRARTLLAALPGERTAAILASASPEYRERWSHEPSYPPNTVGHLMQPPVGLVPEQLTIGAAIEVLRRLAGHEMITYLYATDAANRLTGVVVLRDLLLHPREASLSSILIRPAFFLTPTQTVLEAMRATVSRHYPVYPVCNADAQIVGLVRGHALFEAQAVIINAQQGSLVGLRTQESLASTWKQVLIYRHPWLQFSLLAGLLPVLVVSTFQETLLRFVALAVFAPLIAHQARNCGSQTMAITLRSLNSGEWLEFKPWQIVSREALLAALNGSVIGIVGGLFLAWLGQTHGIPTGRWVGLMSMSMAVSCLFGACFGIATPLTLRLLRADPAHASSIVFSAVVTTLSQWIFLTLAGWYLG